MNGNKSNGHENSVRHRSDTDIDWLSEHQADMVHDFAMILWSFIACHRQPLLGSVVRGRCSTIRNSVWRVSSTTTAEETTIDWENFEFSKTPKHDPRFKVVDMSTQSDSEEESAPSTTPASATRPIASAPPPPPPPMFTSSWRNMSPELLQIARRGLDPYVRGERVERISQVLTTRTKNVHFLFENPGNPSNVYACLRTLDSFAVQHVHIVVDPSYYQGTAASFQKRSVGTAAAGSAQWLTVHRHASTAEAVQFLRDDCGETVQLLAADVNADSSELSELFPEATSQVRRGDDISSDNNGIIVCVAMGNEERGISDELRKIADASFYLPMHGFCESFNLSVATAVTLATLRALPHSPLQLGTLSDKEKEYLLVRGMYRSISQRKVADALLRKAGVHPGWFA